MDAGPREVILRDVIPQLREWIGQGHPTALATVVRTWGSSPAFPARNGRDVRGRDGRLCERGLCRRSGGRGGAAGAQRGRPVLLHYGVADDTALEVGLACGGEIDIFVEPLARPACARAAGRDLALIFSPTRSSGGLPTARLTVIRGPEGWLGQNFGLAARRNCPGLGGGKSARGTPAAGAGSAPNCCLRTQDIRVEGREVEVFVETQFAPPTLAIIGAVHIAVEPQPTRQGARLPRGRDRSAPRVRVSRALSARGCGFATCGPTKRWPRKG